MDQRLYLVSPELNRNFLEEVLLPELFEGRIILQNFIHFLLTKLLGNTVQKLESSLGVRFTWLISGSLFPWLSHRAEATVDANPLFGLPILEHLQPALRTLVPFLSLFLRQFDRRLLLNRICA